MLQDAADGAQDAAAARNRLAAYVQILFQDATEEYLHSATNLQWALFK